jgi:hypothetical protein
MQRCDRDEASGQRADVRAKFWDTGRRVATDPIVRAAARVRFFIQTAVIHAQSLPRKLEASQLVIRQEQHIDVEQDLRREPVVQDLSNYLTCGSGGRPIIDLAGVGFDCFKRHRNPRNIGNHGLHRRRHRA